MCIAVFRWAPDSDEPLILASNRDEFFERPTQAMHWWPGDHILAGKDLRNNGTWLGITRSGRFAMLTNIRDPSLRRVDPPSRGGLVREFLESTASPHDYLSALLPSVAKFQGFNLICGLLPKRGAARSLWFLNSGEAVPRALPAGDYALSNATLDTPWPKLLRLKTGFAATLDKPDELADTALLQLLADSTRAANDLLPSTGIPLPMERALSSIFIRYAPDDGARATYGTRASTLLRINDESAKLCELTHTADTTSAARNEFTFTIGHSMAHR